jgi:adenylate kinase family enzyme
MVSEGLQGRRIAVIGNSGSGKSTLARALATRLGVPHVELDALTWQPGWRALHLEAPEAFASAVAQAIAGEAWVTDGNYSKDALPQILPRATDVVWLDYSRALIMTRVLRRSFVRAATGAELWPGTGNREDFRRWLDKEHPIRWTWDTYRAANARRAERFASPELAHARKHRFTTPGETKAWLGRIPRVDSPRGATPPSRA